MILYMYAVIICICYYICCNARSLRIMMSTTASVHNIIGLNNNIIEPAGLNSRIIAKKRDMVYAGIKKKVLIVLNMHYTILKDRGGCFV